MTRTHTKSSARFLGVAECELFRIPRTWRMVDSLVVRVSHEWWFHVCGLAYIYQGLPTTNP